MANTPELEPILTSPESTRDTYRRRAIMAGLAIGLSLAATFGANRAVENQPRTIPTEITADLPNGQTLGAGAEIGAFDVIPGEDALQLPGIELSIGTRDQSITTVEHISPETDVQLMEWARKFDVDPASGEINPNGPAAIESAVNKVHQLESEGWTIDRITVQGFASDEGDDRDGENPGFGLPTNEKNIKLANKRAGVVGAMFEQQLGSGVQFASTNPNYQITFLEGEEVRDDQLAVDIETVADDLGANTDDLVMQFNRDPESLPEEAREVLSELYDDRFVRIEVEASREIQIPGEEKRGSIILIPLFIPIPKRRPVPVAPEVTKPKPTRPKFPHPPRNLGSAHPGHGRMTQRIKQPDTSNAHYGKGSGHSVAASRRTNHRGNHG